MSFDRVFVTPMRGDPLGGAAPESPRDICEKKNGGRIFR